MRRPGIAAPDPSLFDDQDYGRQELLRGRTLDLSTARAASDPLEMRLPGRFVWFTNDSDGQVNLRFNDRESLSVPAAANFFVEAIAGAVINRVYLDWSAQAGKQVVIAHGTDLRLRPSNDVQNVGQIVAPVDVSPAQLGNDEFWTTGSLATLFQLVTPAANTAGVLVTAMSAYANNGTARFMAKSSAPSSWADAAAQSLLLGGTTSNAGNNCANAIAMPIVIPAGVGFYYQASGAIAQISSATFRVL